MESDEVGMKREAMRGNCLKKENVTLDFWSLVAFLYAFLIFIFCVFGRSERLLVSGAFFVSQAKIRDK